MDATLFYSSAAVALLAAVLVITRTNAVHALLYMVVALIALATAFIALRAPFAAALQVIVYAGAIMVLFIFVIMMLNQGAAAVRQERAWNEARAWAGPGALAALLLSELLFLIPSLPPGEVAAEVRQLGVQLFGPYLLAVEAASLLLLAGLAAAWHVGRGEKGVP